MTSVEHLSTRDYVYTTRPPVFQSCNCQRARLLNLELIQPAFSWLITFRDGPPRAWLLARNGRVQTRTAELLRVSSFYIRRSVLLHVLSPSIQFVYISYLSLVISCSIVYWWSFSTFVSSILNNYVSYGSPSSKSFVLIFFVLIFIVLSLFQHYCLHCLHLSAFSHCFSTIVCIVYSSVFSHCFSTAVCIALSTVCIALSTALSTRLYLAIVSALLSALHCLMSALHCLLHCLLICI